MIDDDPNRVYLEDIVREYRLRNRVWREANDAMVRREAARREAERQAVLEANTQSIRKRILKRLRAFKRM